MAEPWTGLPGLKSPRAFIEPMQQVDAGAASDALNRTIAQVAGQVQKVIQPMINDQAEEAGATSVTRDDQGVLQVRKRWVLSEADEVFNNAAEAAYVQQLGTDFKQTFMKLRQQPNLQMDPEAFRVAAEGLLEGTLDSAPDGMRGAVASLFNQELSRNLGDISDMQQRAQFQRQESALKAGIEAAQNDVFRLAEGGGLTTPEGVQAVQQYISAVRQQENPIWGVSPEAIQQEIENTLSIAKGYGARNAIMGVYRSSGVEAAQAATRQFLTDPSMNLTPAQRRSLESDIMGEIGAMDSLARSRRAEANTAMTAMRAANDAALDVAISDFVTYGGNDPKKYEELRTQIQQAYEKNAINPSSYSSSITKLNTGMRESADKALKNEALVAGAAARIGTTGFDPGDTEQMKELTAYWLETNADVPPEEQLQKALGFSRTNYAIPEPVVEMLKPGLYAAGNPERQAATAKEVMKFVEANRGAANKAFSDSELERAGAINEALNTGYDAASAVKMVDEMASANPDVLAMRKTQTTDRFKKGSKSGDKPGVERVYVQDQMAGWGIDVDGLLESNPERVEQVIDDYKVAFDRSYARFQSVDGARLVAEREMRSKWGPTMWGRETGETSFWSVSPLAGMGVEVYQPDGVALGAYAPEVVYGAGLPAEQAFAYQALDLTARLMSSGYKAEDYGLKSWGEVGRLTPIFAGTATPDGNIGYHLQGPDGRLIPGADGLPLVWQPDMTMGAAAAEAARAAAEAAARAADDTATGFPLGGDEE